MGRTESYLHDPSNFHLLGGWGKTLKLKKRPPLSTLVPNDLPFWVLGDINVPQLGWQNLFAIIPKFL